MTRANAIWSRIRWIFDPAIRYFKTLYRGKTKRRVGITPERCAYIEVGGKRCTALGNVLGQIRIKTGHGNSVQVTRKFCIDHSSSLATQKLRSDLSQINSILKSRKRRR